MPRKNIIMFVLIVLSFMLFMGCSDNNSGEPYDDSYLCDPTIPVILNGITIPEGKIERGPYGCVTEIHLDEMHISDPNCLHGIEEYGSMLEEIWLHTNQLTTIDISPLAECRKIEVLSLGSNSLTAIDLSPLSGCENCYSLNLAWNEISSIDLAPLSSCTHLYQLTLSNNSITSADVSIFEDFEFLYILDLDNNPLDSATCAQLCEFADSHQDCHVWHDCDCGGK